MKTETKYRNPTRVQLLLIAWLFSVQKTFSEEYKIGMIVQKECCSWDAMYITGGAMNIAIDQLKDDQVVDGVNFSIVIRETKAESDGVANIVTLVRDDDVDVIFGPPSSLTSIPAAHLTSNWNFPEISWVSTTPELSNKKRFTTFVRTLGPYSKIGIAFVAVFEKFNWKRVGILHADSGICLWSTDGILERFRESNITVAQRIEFTSETMKPGDLHRYLSMLKLAARIIIICDIRIADIMIKACQLGMCTGEYVFFMPLLTVGRDFDKWQIWKLGDGRDEEAKHAYRYLFFVTLANWYGANGRDRYTKFMENVIMRTQDPPWNDDFAQRNNISKLITAVLNQPTGEKNGRNKRNKASSFSQNLFDAMYFYGLWINYTRATGTDHRDGRAMVAFSDGFTFYSAISGPCHFDNGDRVPLYWFWDITNEDGYPRIVAVANTAKRENKLEYTGELKGFQWQTKDGSVPPDTPMCGFYNELCPVYEKDNSVAIIATCLSVVALTAAGSIIIYILRKRQIENNMMKMLWRIDINEIDLQKARAGLGSRISLVNVKQSVSQLSFTSSSSATNTGHGQVMTNIGLFKGQVVAIKTLSNFRGELTRTDLLDLKEMREIQHDNINPFIGACLDCPSACALFLYCSKGSLQDILENDDIKLDLLFKNSFMSDLAEGIHFIHCSALGSHGRLKSSNCLIDNRWVLKITDYGMNRFIEQSITSDRDQQQDKSLLWTAPELLTMSRIPRNGTKEGDVYSFGIILHEIFFRMGTFSGQTHMTTKDIVERVQKRESIPCRPVIHSDVADVSTSVIKLMQLCWIDNENVRPTSSHIRSYIKKNIKGTTKNIVDIILKRLEKYASNLEDLVSQRTTQLMEEKQKTDRLLYRMLPASCADQLKAGQNVPPELYESATVFFSDIVGFTTIAAMSTPIQVIDLLNDLYTCFDDVITQHDAYKVETIGDAYLVVSGIPKRNGNLHVGEIADMALHILKALKAFKLPHLPTQTINVRIGMHTGPCCAGVVGISMPRYCLFGDTVNTASRMETTGESMRVHMSETSAISLHRLGAYYISLRGEIDVKGKGKMRTYWLDGKNGLPVATHSLCDATGSYQG